MQIDGSLYHDDEAVFVKFAKGDRCLVTSGIHTVKRWDVSTALLDGDELVAHICYDRLKPNRKLTIDEHRATLINDAPIDPIEACRSILPEPSIKAGPT